MFNEEKFYFDIENIKKDLAIEDMFVTEADVDMLRRYSNNEITMDDMLNIIKQGI